MKIKAFLLIVWCFMLCVSLGAAEEIAAYVNEQPITEAQLQDRLQTSNIINTYATAEMTQAEKDEIARIAREAALMVLIQEEALLDEAEKHGLGLDNPTVEADADARYDRMIASAREYVLQSYPDMTGEALDAQVDSLLQMTGASRASYREIANRSAVLHALDEHIAAELLTPDEAAIEARYQALYEEQKALFDQDHNSFEAALLQNKVVVYRPKPLKLIQKAEFVFEDEALALIRQTAAINTDMAEDMRADQRRLLKPTVDAQLQALLNGEKTFAQLLDEIEAGSSQKMNYFHPDSTRFNQEYYSRANAFANVGEISTCYEMTTGYAVLYYAGDLPACEQVPLAEVRDGIVDMLAQENTSASLEKEKERIVQSASIVICEREEP